MNVTTQLAIVFIALLGEVPVQEPKIPDSVKKAQAKLDADPNDQDANLVVGKYLLGQEKFDEALERLAKGTDPILKGVAQKDISKPDDMVAMAGEWIEAAKKSVPFRNPMVNRAIYWYSQAWFKADDKEKAKLRPMIAKLASPPPGFEKPDKKGESVFGWDYSEVTVAFTDNSFAHSGRKSVKILPMGKARKDFSYANTAMLPIVEKKKYIFSAWVFSERTDVDGKMDIVVLDNKGGPKALLEQTFLIPQDCPFWQKIAGEVEMPEGAFRVLIHFETKTTTGALWVDDVSIVLDGKDAMRNGGLEDKK